MMSVTIPGMLENIPKQQQNENKDKKKCGKCFENGERFSTATTLSKGGLPLEKGELVRKTIHCIKKTLSKGGLILPFKNVHVL